ncbi:MAG TPA: NAD(P)H-hydrate epimerase, partial [Ktedonobacterales bacterium]|nr:NAD(P)H-hydrate epimerase [Ktedonobacterales bacterium]
MRVVTVEQMRAIEAEAERRYGLDGPALMAHAGASAAAIAREWLGGTVLDTRWLMLVGPGNNGGDALVMARHLVSDGAAVTLFDWKAQQLQQLDEAGAVTTTVVADDEALTAAIAQSDVVVDALLGIGHSRPLSDSMIAVNKLVRSEYVRRKGRPRVVALDLPSGVNADTGAVDVGTLAADMTITLACPKIGLLCYPGAAYVGELHTGSIGLPDEMDLGGVAEQVMPEIVAAVLPERPANSHKGTYGKVIVLAGSPEFPGAALLAATAAGRIGAGLITIATTPALAASYVGTLPEAVYVLLPDDPIIRAQALIDGIRERDIDALVIGPGLGQAGPTATMLLALLDRL